MIKFYFNGSPNPTKIALALEEMGSFTRPFPSIRGVVNSSTPTIWRSIRMPKCRQS